MAAFYTGFPGTPALRGHLVQVFALAWRPIKAYLRAAN